MLKWLFFISLSPQALGSMYFIHKMLKNVDQYDFKGKIFIILLLVSAGDFFSFFLNRQLKKYQHHPFSV